MSFESKTRNPRKSTREGAHHFFKVEENEQVLSQLKSSHLRRKIESHRTSSVDEYSPINILVFAGGGMKGYGHVGMLRGLNELNGGEDFLQYFDLIGGSSVGAGTALAGRTGTSIDMEKEGKLVIDGLRKDVFKRLNLLRLMKRGKETWYRYPLA